MPTEVPVDNLFTDFARQLLGGFVGDTTNAAFGRFTLRDVNQMSGHTKKARVIYPPNDEMRLLQGRVLNWLRGLEVPLPHATGGLPGNSPLLNVHRHRRHRYFYLTDLKGAFESLLAGQVAAALVVIEPLLHGSEGAVEQFLWEYCCTEQGGIATGSPSANWLFNLALGTLLDGQLGDYCAGRGITYTRYIDDLTFS